MRMMELGTTKATTGTKRESAIDETDSPLALHRLVLTLIGGLLTLGLVAGAPLASHADDVGGEDIVIGDDGDDDYDDEEEDVERDWARTGPYAQLTGALAIEQFNWSGDNDLTGGVGARIGYRVVPRLSLEAHAEWDRWGEGSPTGDPLDIVTVTVNWRAYFTESRIQPYMIFGLGALVLAGDNPEFDDTADIMLRVGLGADWNITERIGIVSEFTYNPALDKLSKVDFFSFAFGVQYKF